MVTHESCLVHRTAALPSGSFSSPEAGRAATAGPTEFSLGSPIRDPRNGEEQSNVESNQPIHLPGPQGPVTAERLRFLTYILRPTLPGLHRVLTRSFQWCEGRLSPPWRWGWAAGRATTSWQDGDADRDLRLITASGASHNAVFPGCGFLHFLKHRGLSYNCQCFILPNTYINQSQLLPLSSHEDRTSVKKVGKTASHHKRQAFSRKEVGEPCWHTSRLHILLQM